MAHYAARVDVTHIEDRLTFKWLIIIRIVNPVIMYFFISVCSVSSLWLSLSLTLWTVLLQPAKRCLPSSLQSIVCPFNGLYAASADCDYSSYGGWGFVIYWMMSWLAMCAVGGAVESVITILTPRFISFFLLIWIIGTPPRSVSLKLSSPHIC